MAIPIPSNTMRAGTLVAICILLQFTLATKLLPQQLRPGGSLLDDILGSSRSLVAEKLYERADRYFHMGVGHIHKRSLTNSWFEVMSATVSPRAHIHPDNPQAIEDIIPWLLMAIRTAPDQDTAYVVAAYWLSRELGRHEDALRVLDEGIPRVKEPHSLLISRGRILLRLHRWQQAADTLGLAVSRAEALKAGGTAHDQEQLQLDLREALLLGGFANEAAGRTSTAIHVLSRYVATSDKPLPAIEKRIADLKGGRPPSPSAIAFFGSREPPGHGFDEHGHEMHDHHHE